jgi:hypothetical protein
MWKELFVDLTRAKLLCLRHNCSTSFNRLIYGMRSFTVLDYYIKSVEVGAVAIRKVEWNDISGRAH